MVINQSKLFKNLDRLTNYYKLIKEADEPLFPEDSDKDADNKDNNDVGDDDLDISIGMDPSEEDPTETPAPDDIPENEKGEYISDTKLAMFASTLLKAYQAKPTNPIPSKLLNVTRANANEVIKYIEDNLELDKPTEDIKTNLTQL